MRQDPRLARLAQPLLQSVTNALRQQTRPLVMTLPAVAEQNAAEAAADAAATALLVCCTAPNKLYMRSLLAWRHAYARPWSSRLECHVVSEILQLTNMRCAMIIFQCMWWSPQEAEAGAPGSLDRLASGIGATHEGAAGRAYGDRSRAMSFAAGLAAAAPAMPRRFACPLTAEAV